MLQISVAIQSATWPLWRKLVNEVEELGFAGLYVPDHLPGTPGALELIVALTYLAQQTKRIHFSPMVAPLSVRDARTLAWQAATLNELSDGRMILGLGTGWHEHEHQTWGYPLGSKSTRTARFEEGLQVITSLLRGNESVTFEGRFYQLQGAHLRLHPEAPPSPRILIGGNGPRRIMPLVAQYADIWNANAVSVVTFKKRSALLDDLLRQIGRQPGDVKRTLFLPVLSGRSDDEIKQRLGWLYKGLPQLASLPLKEQLHQIEQIFTPILTQAGAEYCPIVGTPDEAIEHIRLYANAGVEELIIQWPDANDIDGLRLIAKEIIPHFN